VIASAVSSSRFVAPTAELIKTAQIESCRLTGSTHYNNERAIRLYEKFGFEREGVKRHALRIDGQYIDALYIWLSLSETNAQFTGHNVSVHR